jgi:hypothetical protein
VPTNNIFGGGVGTGLGGANTRAGFGGAGFGTNSVLPGSMSPNAPSRP